MKPRPVPGFRLVGEDGNAFAILGRFSRCAKKAGVSKEEIDAVLTEARSGDYNHLLRAVMPWEEDEGEEEDDE